MSVRPLACLFLSAAPLAAASNQEERLSNLEREVAKLQTLVRALDTRLRPPLETNTHQQTIQKSSGHIVRTGDSYWSIARKYDVPVSALQRANPGVDPRRLSIGKTLRIPGHLQTATDTPTIHTTTGTYTVQRGDILGRISESHGIRLHQLLAANPGLDPRRLQIGTVLNIPGQSVKRAPEPTPVAEPSSPSPATTPIPKVKHIEEFQPAPPPEIPGLSWDEAAPDPVTSAFDHRQTKLVTVENNMRLLEVASRHSTSVAILNQLNELNLSPEQMIKTGSQLYVPGR